MPYEQRERRRCSRPEAVKLTKAVRGGRPVSTSRLIPMSREALERIIETATSAPSGKNRQNWRIFVIRGRCATASRRSRGDSSPSTSLLREYYEDKVVEFTRGFFRDFGGAPVVLCLLYGEDRGRPVRRSSVRRRGRAKCSAGLCGRGPARLLDDRAGAFRR